MAAFMEEMGEIGKMVAETMEEKEEIVAEEEII